MNNKRCCSHLLGNSRGFRSSSRNQDEDQIYVFLIMSQLVLFYYVLLFTYVTCILCVSIVPDITLKKEQSIRFIWFREGRRSLGIQVMVVRMSKRCKEKSVWFIVLIIVVLKFKRYICTTSLWILSKDAVLDFKLFWSRHVKFLVK